MSTPVRILTAVPICDGHDSAINTVNLELIRHGVEVIYLGYHRPARDVVRAAIQEDVRAIGISSYNGGHVEFFVEVVKQLRKRGADDIAVFGGGGGTITHDDQRMMQKRGVDKIFFAGTSLTEMVDFVRDRYAKRPKRRATTDPEMKLARKLTEIEESYAVKSRKAKGESRKSKSGSTRVIGFTGPGGAGKTTLIDELVLRLLKRDAKSRIAILTAGSSIRPRRTTSKTKNK
jgi:methylmalonyl-CoA mutase